ncbi:MAG: CoA transferase, partial [Deltaproteobacteria bacterium]|nr:CoA transferase [Deltaproteobacteria bacterium]
ERIAAQPASYWEQRFAGQDVCCTLVRTLEEALNSPQFQARGVFKARVRMKEGSLRALPVPIVPEFRDQETPKEYPAVGEGNGELLG